MTDHDHKDSESCGFLCVHEDTVKQVLAGMPGDETLYDLAELLSGCVNLTGPLRVRVTKEFGESTVAKILDLVENAASKKAKAENFITKSAPSAYPSHPCPCGWQGAVQAHREAARALSLAPQVPLVFLSLSW